MYNMNKICSNDYFSLKRNLLFFFTEKDYKKVKHSHDVWLAAKNLGKNQIAVRVYIFLILKFCQSAYSDFLLF